MKRRATTRGKAGKAARRSTKKRQTGQLNSASNLEDQLRERTHELAELRKQLAEALDQQVATSEVLQVISSSPSELKTVFDAMLANATRLCDAKFATLYLRDADSFRAISATHDAPLAYLQARKPGTQVQPPADGPLMLAAATKKIAHIIDLSTLQSYRDRNPFVVSAVELGGFRTVLGVPMLKKGDLIGVITVNRQEVRPFTDRQIKLVENFSVQAVIAIENAGLLNELRQRTDDLSEALEQQTATSEVLRVISSSPGELQSVFNAMLENAVRICGAKFGQMFLTEGDHVRLIADLGLPQAWTEFNKQRGAFVPASGAPLSLVTKSKQVCQTADMMAFNPEHPAVRFGGARTLIAVPMLKEGKLIGAIAIYRQEVRPFNDKQIELVQNFAAQAVIAIENTRLLNELRETLDRQTATSEVLRVISSSPGELEPVFQAMLENATRICEAKFATLFRIQNGAVQLATAVCTENSNPNILVVKPAENSV
jgi:GAF domain-containing protein